MEDLIVRYFHFIGIIFLTGTLTYQHLLLRGDVTNANFKNVCRTDIFYGLSAVVVLVTGLLLWLGVGKEASFYSSNPLFHVKLTMFVLMALFSIVPTMYYLKNKNTSDEIVVVPKKIIMFQRVQLLFLILIPMVAVLVAAGKAIN
ncbi:DUF2214 family protein [Arcobacter sp. YIC-464]|uniref:DUF2214 family protein n=1 Tax=Arcobacter sp. YIC-464 TaxID=3376631 RepID=UPI003C1F2DBB